MLNSFTEKSLTKLALVLSLIVSILVLGSSLQAAPPWPVLNIVRTNISKEIKTPKSLDDFIGLLMVKTTNYLNREVPVHNHPREIIRILDEMEEFLDKLPSDSPVLKSYKIQEAYQRALVLLISGRGYLGYSDKSEWFLGNTKGPTGQEELLDILSKNRFDKRGIENLKNLLQAGFNFDTPDVKIKAGFPPDFSNYIDENFLNHIFALLDSATPHSDYEYPVNLFMAKMEYLKLEELIASHAPNGKFSRNLIEVLSNFTEKILYNDSIEMARRGKGFPEYYGREKEFAQIIQGLSRIEKGHILLTGKAGVGKTTMLRMLSDAFVQNKISIRGSKPALIVELNLMAVTNNNPAAIKAIIEAYKELAQMINRHVILYVDEAHIATKITKNAMKSFLSEKLTDDNNRVHFVWSTTSQEARAFMEDVAFTRRWTMVDIPEFTPQQSIELIKKSYLPLWTKEHVGLTDISDDAYRIAAKLSKIEQAEAGNPTGIKELLEATIIYKGYQTKGYYKIEQQDVLDYLRFSKGHILAPGDPDLMNIFSKLWAKFNQKYVGQEGLKAQLKKDLLLHFSSPEQMKMTAMVFAGPPGGGKTFAAQQISKVFYGNDPLILNGGEYKNGKGEINKLIGSPTGYVGSEEQRSVLTKFMVDNPKGGVIVIEEADYMHQDVIQFFTNMITDAKFSDGLGMSWDASKYILVLNTNIGQDLMIPSNVKNKMTWEQYFIRRGQMMEKVKIDGKVVEVVRSEKMDQVFERFIGEIVSKSNPGADTSNINQEAQKQKRRYSKFYVMPPTKEELIMSAKNRVKEFALNAEENYGVKFIVSDSTIMEILDIENFEFEKGYSYVHSQLNDKLFQFANIYFHQRGSTIKISINHFETSLGNRMLPDSEIVFDVNGKIDRHGLGVKLSNNDNQWANSLTMRERIKKFPQLMSENLKGNVNQIQGTMELLKLKTIDWNTRVVITQLGTTGNGKTEFFKSMAKSLYGDQNAMFKITGLNHPYDLTNYFRPSTGVQGGLEETEFERWFKSRLHAGGGVILFDELLSLSGLQGQEISNKIGVINKLYDLLDEGFLEIGNKKFDARGFVIGITGNALQEAFKGIEENPESTKLIARIIRKTSRDDIAEYFEKMGIDAPKVARFGKIYLNGPLPNNIALEVSKAKIEEVIKTITKNLGRKVKVKLPEELAESIMNRVTTITEGMRKVDQVVEELVKAPIAGIIHDLGEDVNVIEAKLSENGKIEWYVDKKRVVLKGTVINNESGLENRVWTYKKELKGKEKNKDRSPQVNDIKVVVDRRSPEELRTTAIHEVYGHWMAAVLLTGENPSETISLVPGKGYDGYVRPKEHTRYPNTLSDLIKRIAYLEAGHRAVFLEGIKATGGGTFGNRDPKEMPSDDLGKIERDIQTMISNQLVSDVSEFSNQNDIQATKDVIRALGKNIADELIILGKKSGEFEEIFNKILATKYLDEANIDLYVTKINWSKLGGDHKEIYKKVLAKAMKKTKEKLTSKQQKIIYKDLAFDLVKEIETWNPSKVKIENESCSSLIKKFMKSVK